MANPPVAVSGDPPADDRRRKLMEIAPTLVAIEAWCRRQGLDDIATELAPAVDSVERALIDPSA